VWQVSWTSIDVVITKSIMPTLRASSSVTFALIMLGLCATTGFAADSASLRRGRDPSHQVAEQVTRLVATIKDEYAEEYPRARRIKFVDTANFDRIALATFFIEGFGGGNNSHQFLAVFAARSIPRTPSNLPYYSLAAVVEVGEGCAVDPQGVRVSASRGPTRAEGLSLSIPTFVSSVNGSCNGITRATYSFEPGAQIGQLVRRN
jgi:hypothetical protein